MTENSGIEDGFPTVVDEEIPPGDESIETGLDAQPIAATPSAAESSRSFSMLGLCIVLAVGGVLVFAAIRAVLHIEPIQSIEPMQSTRLLPVGSCFSVTPSELWDGPPVNWRDSEVPCDSPDAAVKLLSVNTEPAEGIIWNFTTNSTPYGESVFKYYFVSFPREGTCFQAYLNASSDRGYGWMWLYSPCTKVVEHTWYSEDEPKQEAADYLETSVDNIHLAIQRIEAVIDHGSDCLPGQWSWSYPGEQIKLCTTLK